MIYGFTAFAGFEAAAALGEEARNSRRSVPASIAAIRIMFTMGRDHVLPGSLGRLSRHRFPVVAIGWLAVITLLIGLPLTYVYGGVPTFGYLAGVGSLPVVLIYLTVNIAVIRAFRTEFRDEFRLGRHLVIPAAATVVFLFPCGGSCSRAPTR
jgi:amino acid transporter